MCSRFIRATCAVVLALGAAVAAAAGDAYPNKPIRFIAAGGPTEIVTRLLAERMTQSMGVPVIVEASPAPAATSARTPWPRPRPMATPS